MKETITDGSNDNFCMCGRLVQQQTTTSTRFYRFCSWTERIDIPRQSESICFQPTLNGSSVVSLNIITAHRSIDTDCGSYSNQTARRCDDNYTAIFKSILLSFGGELRVKCLAYFVHFSFFVSTHSQSQLSLFLCVYEQRMHHTPIVISARTAHEYRTTFQSCHASSSVQRCAVLRRSQHKFYLPHLVVSAICGMLQSQLCAPSERTHQKNCLFFKNLLFVRAEQTNWRLISSNNIAGIGF